MPQRRPIDNSYIHRAGRVMEEPKIVALCGSSWFVDIMAVCAWLIERDENAIAMSLHPPAAMVEYRAACRSGSHNTAYDDDA